MSKCYKCGRQWTNENKVETPLFCPECLSVPPVGCADAERVMAVRSAKERLLEAEAMKCVCSDFVLQYERGCQCARREAILAAQSELTRAINAL